MNVANISLNLVKELKLDIPRIGKPGKEGKGGQKSVAAMYDSMFNVADSIAKYEAQSQLYQELAKKISAGKQGGSHSKEEVQKEVSLFEEEQRMVSQVILEFIDKRREIHMQRMINLVEIVTKVTGGS
jgi:hypothetical protein